MRQWTMMINGEQVPMVDQAKPKRSRSANPRRLQQVGIFLAGMMAGAGFLAILGMLYLHAVIWALVFGALFAIVTAWIGIRYGSLREEELDAS